MVAPPASSWYLSWIVTQVNQRFKRLAARFEANRAQSERLPKPDTTPGIAQGMILVPDQMADICMNEHSLLDSKPGATTPSTRH